MEIKVGVNGPEVQQADPVIQKAMRSMFASAKSTEDRDGHFVRRGENVKDYMVSKSVDSFVNKKVSAPFMAI